MKIEDSFRVEVPVEEAWKVLLDLERIAPCLPGAQLTEVEGDEYRGTVKIKVGPITAQYKGVAKIEEADEANHKVVLQAEGRDTRGQGNASATVVATLVADGDAATTVNIDTDLNITGKVAQFGRGVMADVSSKLLGQFADNLKKDVLAGSEAPTDPGPAASTASATTSGTASAVDAGFASTGESDAGPRKIESKEAEPIDLMDAAGGSVGKRLVPIVGGVVVLLVVRSVLKRRQRRRHSRSGLADLGEQAKHQAQRHARKARKEAARQAAEARKVAAKQAKEVGKRAAKQAHELREHAGHAVHAGVRHLGH